MSNENLVKLISKHQRLKLGGMLLLNIKFIVLAAFDTLDIFELAR